jgi:hypothetical protein
MSDHRPDGSCKLGTACSCTGESPALERLRKAIQVERSRNTDWQPYQVLETNPALAAVEEDVAGLTESRDAAVQRAYTFSQKWVDRGVELAASERALEEMRLDLLQYGRHGQGCPRVTDDYAECLCGYGAALSGAAPKEEKSDA